MHVFSVVTSFIHLKESPWRQGKKIQTFLMRKFCLQKRWVEDVPTLCNFGCPQSFRIFAPQKLTESRRPYLLPSSIPCTFYPKTICPSEAAASPWVDGWIELKWSTQPVETTLTRSAQIFPENHILLSAKTVEPRCFGVEVNHKPSTNLKFALRLDWFISDSIHLLNPFSPSKVSKKSD